MRDGRDVRVSAQIRRFQQTGWAAESGARITEQLGLDFWPVLCNALIHDRSARYHPDDRFAFSIPAPRLAHRLADMTFVSLFAYAGSALVYASLLTMSAFAVARKLRWVQSWHAAPFVLSTLFFIILTQHPFPSPGELDCPVPSAAPQLRVFRFMVPAIDLYQAGAGLVGLLSNRTILATLMNFLICAIIGATLSRHVDRQWIASLFGLTLSLGIELTQLTGIWGLYPCAYRQFNVDDLLMNVLGVSLGFWVWRRLRGARVIRGRASSGGMGQ